MTCMFKTTMKKNSESESVKERAKIKMSPPSQGNTHVQLEDRDYRDSCVYGMTGLMHSLLRNSLGQIKVKRTNLSLLLQQQEHPDQKYSFD